MAHKLNEISALASKYVNSTNRHIFLTGKAGTGKTTFLKYIVNQTFKKTVITAPTGIAAINAGGVTLHSLLQLPFGVFIPEGSFTTPQYHSERINTPSTVLANYKLNKTKRKLLQELELLIIDEVSMLRADLLDCIDTVLRHVRRNRQVPFGGVQLLFIGDLLQLPPVAKDTDQQLLSPYYNSNYFFAAHALKNSPPLYLELDKIYRQSDEKFIEVLNRFRDNKVTQTDINLLNTYYKKDFSSKAGEKYIRITTHNHKADTINKRELENIDAKAYTFSGTTTGDFPETMQPVTEQLVLKEGAQVMFIKNDTQEEKRYFNGKIGMVSNISSENIEVTCTGDEPILVEPYEWQNVRYTLNKDTNEIEEKIIGRYVQYPLKLAWAVTVHKSQGLTFERAILDLNDAFAAGQVYVALSRLTSLEGLVLSAPLSVNLLATDAAVDNFSQTKIAAEALKTQLRQDTKNYIYQYSIHSFGFHVLASLLHKHLQSFNKADNLSVKQQYEEWTKNIHTDILTIKDVADTFINQIKKIVTHDKNYLETLASRVEKAREYFDVKLTEIRDRFRKHIEEISLKSKVKQYATELDELDAALYQQHQSIIKIDLLLQAVSKGESLSKSQLQSTAIYQNQKKRSTSDTKKEKTPTREVSYQLYKDGNDIQDIAIKRNLAPGTIAGHLCYYIEQGDVEVINFIEEEKLKNIITVAQKIKSEKLTDIKSKLGEEYSFEDIRFAIAHARASK